MSSKRPDSIPVNPVEYFGDKWTSWEHFLGTKNAKSRAGKWWPYEQAQAYIKEKKLPNLDAWQKWSKVPGNRPKGFPSNPHRRYAGTGWKTWGEFLGTGNAKHNRKRWTECVLVYIYLAREEGRRRSAPNIPLIACFVLLLHAMLCCATRCDAAYLNGWDYVQSCP